MAVVNKNGGSKWLDVQRRKIRRKDAAGNVTERVLPHWYGRMKVSGKWTWFKLYTDKRASQKKWTEIIAEHEQRHAGVITTPMDAAEKTLAEHVTDYLADRKRTVSDKHYRIAKYMLNNFIKLAGWKRLSDINEQSASRVLLELQAQGKTVAYTNQYLTRVKAFLNWCLPARLVVNPLAKLRRGNAKKGVKRRARRPLAEHEFTKLLKTCPPSRRLKYAFPVLSGLRRGELEEVRWGDLHLDSVIPFIQLRPEQTKMGEAVALPLHPYLVSELRNLTPGMPETKLFASLPEGRTLLRDLTKSGLRQTDANGRRADFHALRHTFAKRLDETGCSHATRRALMRHSSGDQTDGYTLARLQEMYEAIKRLPTPNLTDEVEVQAKTGTNDLPLSPDNAVRNREAVVTMWTRDGHEPASTETDTTNGPDTRKMQILPVKPTILDDRHHAAGENLKRRENRDSVEKIGPRSSVG